ncbi:MAG: Ig-like domain-containing protein, partial [Spirochaetaceae bacterium]
MKRQTLRHTAVVVALLLSVLSCQNPFDVGLGENVDIDRPVVSLSTPSTGAFLRGTVDITGTATDDVRVAGVQLSFDNGVTWRDVDSYNAETEQWRYSLDTTTMANGSLTVLVRASDNTGKTTMTETLLFTIDNEAPRVIFTFPAINPETYDEAEPPTVGRNGAIFGTVSVREGIAVGSPEIKVWKLGDSEPDEWTSMRSASDTPNLYDFSHDLPVNEVGDFQFRIRAEDVGGQISETENYRIVVISGAPQVAINSPGQASYQSDLVTVSGTMSHETGNEPALTLELFERDELETADDPEALVVVESTDADLDINPDGSGGYTWSYEYDSEFDPDNNARPDGTIVARVYASINDTTGFDTRAFQVDNTEPTVQVNAPTAFSTVYGDVTISGTASDNEAVETVEIQIGDAETAIFEPATGTYNWQASFDSLAFGNESNAVEVDSNGDPIDVGDSSTDIWRLNVYVRVRDPAGNEYEEIHQIYVDQDLDKPTVNVLAPVAGSNLAGPVLITGTASDADPGVARVEMQIVAIEDAGDEIGLLRPDGTILEPATEWHEVTGTTQWSQEINGNGALYNVTASGRPFEGSGFVHNGRLRIRIRAVDSGGKEGNIQEFGIRLDETIPSIVNVVPASGSYVRGQFTLEAEISDDDRIENVAVSTDGGQTFDVVYAPASGDESETSYDLAFPIDTGAGDLDLVSAVRNMRIRVRDNANYTTINTITLNIDNWWPDGELVTSSSDPMQMAGSDFQLSGNAWDRDRVDSPSGFPVRGLEYIDVYIQDLRSDSPTYEQFLGIDGSAAIGADAVDLGNGQGLRPTISGDSHRIRIRRSDLFLEDGREIAPDGSDFTWSTLVDTNVFPDGPVGVHYLITDRAGNRTHHVENGFVRNNPPVIGSVTVGSDLDYNDSVTADEQFTYASRFNARGRIYIDPTVTGGNGTPTWELFQSTDLTTPLAVSGNVLDISGFSDGDYTFVLRVTDEVGIVAETDVDVRISQDDADAPDVEIFALTQAIAESVAAENPVVG